MQRYISAVDVSDTLNDLAAQGHWSRSANEISDEHAQDRDQKFLSRLIADCQDPEKLKAQTSATRSLESRAAEVIHWLQPATQAGDLASLNHYRLTQLLGAGATGVVFKAVDTKLDRPVALKVLRPSLGELAKQRFLTEAKATAAVDHENIIAIYEVDSTDELAFMATQWVPGQTLEQILLNEKSIPESQVRDIGKQIANGLAAAHQNGLIHRDIKPANIWIEKESGRVKILDFGLARINDDSPKLTETGLIAGTPNYMSPEQTRGESLDHRSDLFSLGCVLFEAATGRQPFLADTILGTLQAVQTQTPPTCREVNPETSSEFSALVQCLLQKEKHNRPTASEAVAAAFETPINAWSFKTETQPTETALQKKPRSNRSGLTPWSRWLGAAVVFAGLLITAFAGPQIIRIATNKGVIEIKTDDPNIKVEIRQNGELVELVDLKTKQKVEIKSGEYTIVPSSNQNAFELSANKIIMTRGGKQVLQIKRIKDSVAGNPANGAGKSNSALDAATSQSPSTKKQAKYDGKTVDQWLEAIHGEKKVEKVAECIEAFQMVQDENSKPRILAEISRALREHGSRQMTQKTQPFWKALVAYFESIEPQDLVALVKKEISTGNAKSRRSLALFLSLPFTKELEDIRLAKVQNLESAYAVELDNLIKPLHKIYQNVHSPDRDWAAEYLANLIQIIDAKKLVNSRCLPSEAKEVLEQCMKEKVLEADGLKIQAYQVQMYITALAKADSKSKILIPVCKLVVEQKIQPKFVKGVISNPIDRDIAASVAAKIIVEFDDLNATRSAIVPLARLLKIPQYKNMTAELVPTYNRDTAILNWLARHGKDAKPALKALWEVRKTRGTFLGSGGVGSVKDMTSFGKQINETLEKIEEGASEGPFQEPNSPKSKGGNF